MLIDIVFPPVCQLFRRGVLAIFGPESRTTSSHIGSICDSLEIPHIQTKFRSGFNKKQSAINLHPDPLSLSQVGLSESFIHFFSAV